MNAGGTGGPSPASLTQDGVTEVFAQNLLGHVVLLEELISAGSLTEVAVLVGSEAARGVPKMRIPRPTFSSSSADEFASVIDGWFFAGHKFNVMLAYGQVKYLGALWMASMARRHPELRFVTMSPGKRLGPRRCATSRCFPHHRQPHFLPTLHRHWGSGTSSTSARSAWPTP